MWQILIIFLISINLNGGDTICPGFSNYSNNVTLLDKLDGDYMVVYTSSTYILQCERISWTLGPDNDRTAYLKDSAGCCRQIDNFDTSNPDYFEHDITPLSTCTHLQSTENVLQKLIASTGTDTDLCLIVYVCHYSRNGLIVACRQPPAPSLWIKIGEILAKLLKLVLPIQVLQTVNQNSCTFPNACNF